MTSSSLASLGRTELSDKLCTNGVELGTDRQTPANVRKGRWFRSSSRLLRDCLGFVHCASSNIQEHCFWPQLSEWSPSSTPPFEPRKRSSLANWLVNGTSTIEQHRVTSGTTEMACLNVRGFCPTAECVITCSARAGVLTPWIDQTQTQKPQATDHSDFPSEADGSQRNLKHVAWFRPQPLSKPLVERILIPRVCFFGPLCEPRQ